MSVDVASGHEAGVAVASAGDRGNYLARVKLRDIMAALGVAKSTASMIRSGQHVPALRHWPALARLAGVE